MSQKTVTIPANGGVDLKGIGYLVSIAGTLLLGSVALPKPGAPSWHFAALIAGMTASIVGFGLRYLAHINERRAIAQAQRDAERR